MFGVQWDLVLKYLETKGTTQADLNDDSTTWGNYCDNLWNIINTDAKYSSNYGRSWTSGAYGEKNVKSYILLSTGASDEFSKQGIYDLAGNVWEWTLEYTSSSDFPCAIRGGNSNFSGSNYPAVCRGDDDTISYNSLIGFRVSLF